MPVLPRPESPRDPFGTPSPEWGRASLPLDAPGGIPPLYVPACHGLPLPAFAPMAFSAEVSRVHGGEPPSSTDHPMGGGSFGDSGVLGEVPQQDPPVDQFHAPLPPENVEAD